jgi:hypothetical protein
MRIRFDRLIFLSLAAGLLLGQSACSAGGGNRRTRDDLTLEITLQELCQESIRSQFSMQTVGDDLHILFPERDTLSLKLLVLDAVDGYRLQDDSAFYLGRISYTPDVDAYFGEHFYHAVKDRQELYFYDRRSETKTVLKHISRTTPADSWWIEILSEAGRLTAALERKGEMDLFVNAGDALLVLPSARGEPAVSVLEPFRAGEAARVLSGSAAAGFTVYDELSRQLYRIRLQDDAYSAVPLLAGGSVHHAALRDGEKLDILTYDPDNSELLLFEEDLPGEFNETAVTLCRGTTSVFLFSVNGRRMFAYNEMTLDRKGNTVFRLSLLYPAAGKYVSKVLFEDSQPVQRFQAAFLNGCLNVAFVQESLRLLSVFISGPGSVEDQDL